MNLISQTRCGNLRKDFLPGQNFNRLQVCSGAHTIEESCGQFKWRACKMGKKIVLLMMKEKIRFLVPILAAMFGGFVFYQVNHDGIQESILARKARAISCSADLPANINTTSPLKNDKGNSCAHFITSSAVLTGIRNRSKLHSC